LEGFEVPTEFTAFTVNVYSEYRVRGPTDTVPACAGKDWVTLPPPMSVAVTVYPVMGTPPVDDGAEKVTHTSVFDRRERDVSAGAPVTVAAWVATIDGAATHRA
jgi:hypothetical protein